MNLCENVKIILEAIQKSENMDTLRLIKNASCGRVTELEALEVQRQRQREGWTADGRDVEANPGKPLKAT